MFPGSGTIERPSLAGSLRRVGSLYLHIREAVKAAFGRGFKRSLSSALVRIAALFSNDR